MDQIVVGVGDCRIADAPGQLLVTYALGSCIALVVHDRVANVGGLLHYMLPDSGIDATQGRENPFKFADTGIPLLLDHVLAHGASKRRLTVHAIGGACMMDQDSTFDIGRRNYQALRRILWKAGLLLHGEAVGGVRSRTVRLEIGSGRLWLQEGGEQRELEPAASKRGGSWHIAS